MKRLRSVCLATSICAAWLGGCGEPAPPVARLAVEPSTLTLGYPGTTEVEYRWSFDREPEGAEGPIRAFVHLLDPVDGLVRTFDYPLGEVAAGEERTVRGRIYQSALAPPLTAGTYSLSVGLYDAAGRRWPIAAAGEGDSEGGPTVATVDVREEGEGYPVFYFSPGWMPVEGGTDRQVLARRWRGEAGTISIAEISREGEVWMMLGVPTAATEVDDLVLEEGAATPSATVTSSCGGSATVEGPGSHEVLLPVAAGPDGALPQECEISLETNFYVISLETLVRRTVALENLAWSNAAS